MTVHFHSLSHPPTIGPTTHVIVSEVLLPLRWWRGVTITWHDTATLSPIERFLLETQLAFGPAAPTEFAAITGLPSTLFPILGRRLFTAGALDSEGSTREALATDRLFTQRTETVDVVFLPATDELVILESRQLLGWEKARVMPAGRYPVNPLFAKATVGDIILAAVGERRHSLRVDAEIQAFPDGLCSVYRCAAQVEGQAVRLSIGDQTNSVNLTGIDQLVAGWVKADQVIAEQPVLLWRALLPGALSIEDPPRPQRITPAQWQLSITGAQAEALAEKGTNLAVPLGLAVESDDVVVEVALHLTAADARAEAILAMDQAISTAASSGSIASVAHDHLLSALKQLPEDLHPAPLWDRAWQLGHYRLAYALREPEDFGYA